MNNCRFISNFLHFDFIWYICIDDININILSINLQYTGIENDMKEYCFIWGSDCFIIQCRDAHMYELNVCTWDINVVFGVPIGILLFRDGIFLFPFDQNIWTSGHLTLWTEDHKNTHCQHV